MLFPWKRFPSKARGQTMQLLIEAEEPGNPRSLFRVSLDGRALGAKLTAPQAHVLAGDVIEDYVLSKDRRVQAASLADEQNTTSAPAV